MDTHDRLVQALTDREDREHVYANPVRMLSVAQGALREPAAPDAT
jgi:hypothetical protein